MSYDDDEKKSSATAKTALGLAIGGLGLAAVNSGMFGGECGNGGFLGGLFGNRGNTCEALARGRQAETELAVIHQYFMPTWNEICNLKQEVAVNKTVEAKNQEITNLLFRMSENRANSDYELNRMRTEAAFALADQKQQCCCDKLNNKIDFTNTLLTQRSDASFALADQKANCNYDRLASDINCTYDRLDAKTNAAFVVSRLETDAKICEATKDLVRGKVYLSPCSMADPYQAGTNVLMSRHIPYSAPACATPFTDCGCNW